jgi:hypothetical protein
VISREDLEAAVAGTSREDLPDLVGALAFAQAEALARLATPAPTPPPTTSELVPLTEAWARAHGYELDTARKLACTGRLAGAMPAPSRGKGRRRRWLVPGAILRPAEAR